MRTCQVIYTDMANVYIKPYLSTPENINDYMWIHRTISENVFMGLEITFKQEYPLKNDIS